MTAPRATYRLQFRGGMTFDHAAGLAPYWRRLGISHLYASPVFAAVAGSTHGYDVTDCNALDESLGGEAGFRRLAAALKAEGLGLIVDFVPNHMAASPQNPWWRDVLRHGRASRYARHFDIFWDDGPLGLSVLGKPFDATVRDGEVALASDSAGGYAIDYCGAAYPLNGEGAALIAQTLHEGVNLERLSHDTAFLHRLHELQHWRLQHWREGRRRLGYRRFFEITDLVGLRVEDAAVFDDVHRTLLALVGEGLIDGIRLDHIDGLCDPAGYLRRLRDRVGPRVYLVVEKILEHGEMLPRDWPVAGTTGYEFIAQLAELMTSGDEAGALDSAYRSFAGVDARDYRAEVAAAKHDILTCNLESELALLTRLARNAVTSAGAAEAVEALREAIVAFAVAMPVYRSYVTAAGPSQDDLRLIAGAEREATATDSAEARVIGKVAALLRLDMPASIRPQALVFAQRFQQTTGPVMAKALEDTVFYRFNRLIGLNEVGGEPSRMGGGVSKLHEWMAARRHSAPFALNATATHDTKRGEDARARLYALSEAPSRWHDAVCRWRRMVTVAAPAPEVEWLLYQALLGVWPAELEAAGPETELRGLQDRFSAYALKAVREAKRQTSWTDPDERFEKAVLDFAAGLFSTANAEFRDDFVAAARPFWRAGAVNSLAQTALKLLAPGVPDIYQGTESWDLSLVDPDNRRRLAPEALAPRLHAALETPLPRLCATWRDGRIKCRVLAAGLSLRRNAPALFAEGGYRRLVVDGPAADYVVAFARRHGALIAVAVAPRLVLARLDEGDGLGFRDDVWRDTCLHLPGVATGAYRDAIGNRVVAPGVTSLSTLLADAPVALLATR